MFGQLRETILTSLAHTKANPVELKNKFAKYTKVLKESKDLNSYYSLYEQVETAYFEDISVAKEFLDECLVELKKSDIKSLNKLRVMSEENVSRGEVVEISERTMILDQLVFNSRLTIKEKFDYKVRLIKNLTAKVEKPISRQDKFNSLDKKVNSEVIKMSNQQKEALSIFLENDITKIKDYYTVLVESLLETIDDLTLETGDPDEVKKIIETRRKLINMKNEGASIGSVDILLQLKESFSKNI